jgi:serine/threonine-protein kinase SRPK3
LSPRVRLIPHRLPFKASCLKSRFTPCRWFERRNRSEQSAPSDDAVSCSDATGEENMIYAEEEPHMLPIRYSGGYCPLTLGENLSIFNEGPTVVGGNFKIVRKLGWGAYSSVWLAESQGCVLPLFGFSLHLSFAAINHRCNKIHTRYQALKLLTVAATSDLVDDKFPEFDNLVRVTTRNPSHPSYHHCTSFLGRMFVRDKYPHFCFVFEPMGTNLLLLQRQQPGKVFSLAVTKRIVKQILLALDYTHTECHLVHTGRTSCTLTRAIVTFLFRSQTRQYSNFSRKGFP